MTASSSHYFVYRQSDPHVWLTLTRPDPNDPKTLLAVPGTYTSPQNTVEGFVVWDGRVVQDKERQGWDGAVRFHAGRITILRTDGGKQLTKAFLQEVAAAKDSLVQAHLLVFQGAPQHFKPQPLFIRRALAVRTDGTVAVIESSAALDLNAFAADLAALGVTDAVNLDMGSWSAGWYRAPQGGVVDIGVMTDATARQSNWIVFRAP